MNPVQSLRTEAVKRAERVTDELAKAVSHPTPAYVAVGLADTVVERARHAGESLAGLGRTLRPGAVQQGATRLVGQVSHQVEAAPAALVGDAMDRLGVLQTSYEGLASRGQGLVTRVKRQQATQDLAAQLDVAVRQARKLVGTAGKGLADTRGSAKSTVTTGRRQAATAVVDVLEDEVTPTARRAAGSTTRTRKAPSRTAGTATAPAKTGTARAGTAKSGTAKSGTAKSGTAKSGTAKSGTAKSGTAKSGTAMTGTAMTGTAKTGTAKTGTATTTTGTAKTETAKTETPKTETATTSGASGPTTTTGRRRSTAAAAKRTATTARNRTAETASVASDTTEAVADVAGAATKAVTDAAAKTGD